MRILSLMKLVPQLPFYLLEVIVFLHDGGSCLLEVPCQVLNCPLPLLALCLRFLLVRVAHLYKLSLELQVLVAQLLQSLHVNLCL